MPDSAPVFNIIHNSTHSPTAELAPKQDLPLWTGGKCSGYVLFMGFSEKYRKQQQGMYFGHWAHGEPKRLGAIDAVAVLQDAARRTYDEDMRTDSVKEAVDWLSAIGAERLLTQWWDALFIEEPERRLQTIRRLTHEVAQVHVREYQPESRY